MPYLGELCSLDIKTESTAGIAAAVATRSHGRKSAIGERLREAATKTSKAQGQKLTQERERSHSVLTGAVPHGDGPSGDSDELEGRFIDRSKFLDIDGLAGWLVEQGVPVDKWTTARERQFLEALHEDVCSGHVDLMRPETRNVMPERVMHVLRVRINHATRPIVLTRTCMQHEEDLKGRVKHVQTGSHTNVVWICHKLQIDEGIPVWNVDTAAKRFITEEVFPDMELHITDVRVAERCAFYEEDHAPFLPMSIPGINTVCINHFYDVYVKHLPLVVLSTQDEDGYEVHWNYMPAEEAEQEPIRVDGLSRKILSLKFLTATVYLKCYQLSAICDAVCKLARTTADALDYQAEVIVALLPRIVDVENLHGVFSKLSDRRYTGVKLIGERIGWLNVLSMEQPNYVYDLNLGVYDEWKVANLLTRLALKEPGENFVENEYCRRLGADPSPGWQVSDV